MTTGRKFTPDVVQEGVSSLVEMLGPTYLRIRDQDQRGQTARPPNPERHLLAVIVENAQRFADEFSRGMARPLGLGELLALEAILGVLGRARSDPFFKELVPQLETDEGFRHHMVMLGMWDHVSRRATDKRIRLQSTRTPGRQVDLVLGDEINPKFHIEVKAPKEFEGSQSKITRTEATTAIERGWKHTFHRAGPQVPPDRPSLLLIGGLTLRLESLAVVQSAARNWLSRHGQSRPNLWGIAALTYFSHITLPPGRRLDDGAPIEVKGRGGVHLAFAASPHYVGAPGIQVLPGYFEDEGPETGRMSLY